MRVKYFVVGILFGVAIGCNGSIEFPFKYYALDALDYGGVLRGPTASADLLLEKCRPTENDRAPCLVMFTADYLQLKKDYLDTKINLKACEAGQ